MNNFQSFLIVLGALTTIFLPQFILLSFDKPEESASEEYDYR